MIVVFLTIEQKMTHQMEKMPVRYQNYLRNDKKNPKKLLEYDGGRVEQCSGLSWWLKENYKCFLSVVFGSTVESNKGYL